MNAAIISGSAGGIGIALIDEFKKAGYYTIGIDKEKSDHADFNIKSDLMEIVSSQVKHKKFFEHIAKALGNRNLKALINNAAVQILGDIEHISVADFKMTMDINLTAPFILSKNLFSNLKEAKGCIINIGSIHAKLTKPKFIAYATSKAALLGMTQAMAIDFGEYVRVNIIQPAAISTEMLIEGFKDNPEGLKQLKSYHPCGFIGKPDGIAKLAIYLASSDAEYINGVTIDINGAIGARLHDPT